MRAAKESVFYLAVGAGMALGTSAFTMVGGLFEVVPLAWALAAIAIAGLFCTAIALSIGELASMWPSAPAIRTYFKMAFGAHAALTLVYIYLAFIVLIAGVESYTFALVVHAMLPKVAPAVTVIVLFASVIAANMHGVELPRAIQVGTTAVCIAIIMGMGAIGLLRNTSIGLEEAGVDAADGLAALPAAVGLAIFLFIGFEWITPVGLTAGAYARRIPLCMLGAIAILLAIYAVVATGLATSLPRARIAGEPVPQVPYFVAVLGPAGVWLAGALSLAAIVSTFNAGLMGGSRLLQAMAREGSLPRWVAIINPATGAPIGAVALLGCGSAGASLLIVAFGLQLLAAVMGAAIICVIYAAYMLAVIRLRRRAPQLGRPFRTPLPLMLQWVVAIVLPVIGGATLFSLPEFGAAPALGVATCATLSAALAAWSNRRHAAGNHRPIRAVPRP